MKGERIFVALDFAAEIKAVSKATGASQRFLANLVRDATLELANERVKGRLLPLYLQALQAKVAQMQIPGVG